MSNPSDSSRRIPALLLILLATVLVLGVGLTVQSSYNLLTLETVVTVIKESGYYKEAGYSSISEWRSHYMQANALKLVLGVFLAGTSAYFASKTQRQRSVGTSTR